VHLAPLYDAKKAWDDHLKRLADIDRLYPSKYPLSARHAAPTPQREFTPLSSEPKDKLAYTYAGKCQIVLNLFKLRTELYCLSMKPA
jgi:hypothetical protein